MQKLYSCSYLGCSDEGALGREIEDEEEETFVPGVVKIPSKVQQICAGDSHTAALTEDGRVYYWGTFRDSSGSFGLTPDGQMQKLPLPLGTNHYSFIFPLSVHCMLLFLSFRFTRWKNSRQSLFWNRPHSNAYRRR